MSANMPAPNSAFLDQNGNVTPAWWALLLTLVSPTSGGGTTSVLAALQAAVASLQALQSYIVGATWSGGGNSVIAPSDDISVVCKASGTIKSATVLTIGGIGSCQVGVWKAPYGSYPPTVANSITGGALPTILSGIKYQDAGLAGWSKAVTAGDVITFHLASSSVFTNIHIELTISTP
jgi:hypothetical protein